MSTPILQYASVFGIEIGDIVRSSHGSSGKVTSLTMPHYVTHDIGVLIIRTWPVCSLTFSGDGVLSEHNLIINDIRREGDRYFTDSNDEVIITKPEDRPIMQRTLFDDEPESYQFRPGVDYTLERGVWQCDQHGDFNGYPDSKWGPAWCSQCNRPAQQIILMPPRVIG